MKFAIPLTLAATIALAACSGAEETAEDAAPMVEETAAPATASATLNDAEGNPVGTVTATESEGGLAISLTVNGLPAGPHGAHIHETGDCSASDFTSAGGHWNPAGTNHGTMSEAPNPHAGDFVNLEVAEDGTGMLEGASNGTLAGLLDADGSAFVIHADPDDYESQPSGNAGARIACGVFSAG